MSARSLGVLVLGAGWVSSQHVAAYARDPCPRVWAIGDRSLVKTRPRATEAGLSDVTFYDDAAKALAHPGVEIVSICTPHTYTARTCW